MLLNEYLVPNRIYNRKEPILFNKHNFTIQEIRSAFPPGKSAFDRENPLGHFVWRRLSYYVAWLFLRLGVSANKVTTLAIAIGCIGCLLIALGFYWSTILGVLFILLRALLDYADGAIARATSSTSRFGGYLDTIHHYVITSLLPIGIGIGLFNRSDRVLQIVIQWLFGLDITRSLFLIVGFSASLLALLTYSISDRFAISFSIKPRDFYRPSDSSKRSVWGFIFRVGLILQNVNGTMMLVLLLAAIFNFLSIFHVTWLIITTAGFIAITTRTMTRAGKLVK
ncbi:CDP-alcohol phosphatidyltransferase family protein [Chloroflexota bacterium]